MKITSTTFVAGCSLLLLCLTCTPETVRADQGMDMMDFEVPSGDDMMDAEASNEVFFLLSEKVGTYFFIQCPVPERCPPISSPYLAISLLYPLRSCCLPSFAFSPLPCFPAVSLPNCIPHLTSYFSSLPIQRTHDKAALTTAEATVLSLEEQLKASSEELADKAERLSASENEISELSEQVKELSSKLLKGETAATVAATKGEMAALTSKLEQAQEEVRELSEKVKTLEATVAESEWQAEKAEDEKQILRKDLAEMTEGKRAAETSLDGAKDVAGLAFDRVKYLEGQVAKAKSDAVTARKTWEEELRLKDKEVVETKAKLQDAIDNKYSFRVLSEDLSAWSKKARAVMKIW